MNFQESTGGHGKLVKNASNKVPCFPLETILLAINVSTVDFFSLDVEGFELHILRTLPPIGLNIRSLVVEYIHGVEGEYKSYMELKGYILKAKLHVHKPEAALYVDDLIFVKRNVFWEMIKMKFTADNVIWLSAVKIYKIIIITKRS